MPSSRSLFWPQTASGCPCFSRWLCSDFSSSSGYSASGRRERKRNRRPVGRDPDEEVLGGGLEPPCLAAYAPQTYVSAISQPERILEAIRFRSGTEGMVGMRRFPARRFVSQGRVRR